MKSTPKPVHCYACSRLTYRLGVKLKCSGCDRDPVFCQCSKVQQ